MKDKKKKGLSEEQRETVDTKDFFDRAVPGIIRFYPEYYVCGNFYKSCWAVTEYPPTTEERSASTTALLTALNRAR